MHFTTYMSYFPSESLAFKRSETRLCYKYPQIMEDKCGLPETAGCVLGMFSNVQHLKLAPQRNMNGPIHQT